MTMCKYNLEISIKQLSSIDSVELRTIQLSPTYAEDTFAFRLFELF